jgi:hypothetical protein
MEVPDLRGGHGHGFERGLPARTTPSWGNDAAIAEIPKKAVAAGAWR